MLQVILAALFENDWLHLKSPIVQHGRSSGYGQSHWCVHVSVTFTWKVGKYLRIAVRHGADHWHKVVERAVNAIIRFAASSIPRHGNSENPDRKYKENLAI